MPNNPLDYLPLSAVFISLILLFSLAFEVGFRQGRSRLGEDTVKDLRASQASTALGAMLALCAFLLAFTFGMAGSQYDTRRRLVIDEVNAIGTTFLRTAHIPEPHRSRSRRLLKDYVEIRRPVVARDHSEWRSRSEELHDQLWAEATAVAEKQPNPIGALFVQAVNVMIDFHGSRTHVVLWKRIPFMLLETLAFLTILSMWLMGYWVGLASNRHILLAAVLILAYATVFLMVIDLDRPHSGIFRVNEEPLADLQKTLADGFTRPPLPKE